MTSEPRNDARFRTGFLIDHALSGAPILILALVLVYGITTWLAITYYAALPEGIRGGTKWDVALALVVYGVSGLGYFVAVAQMTEAGRDGADSGITGERRASVERSESDASR